MNLGATQMTILRTCVGGAGFVCSGPNQYDAALRLVDRGLLDRDLARGASHRFVGNRAGESVVKARDAALARMRL